MRAPADYAPRPVRRLPEPPLGLIVFTVGFSILGAEIAAARLLAPYFGASTIVWANTIGIVLVALSIGYWYGGQLADRNPTRGGPVPDRAARGAAARGRAVRRRPVPRRRPSTRSTRSRPARSSARCSPSPCSSRLPILVSGAVAPYALRLAVADVAEAGTVSGRLYAISTVGSLLGTFASALLLHPAHRHAPHVRRLRARARRHRGDRARARGATCSRRSCSRSLLALPVGTVKGETDAGARVIHETDTEYQYARVVEDADGTRTLELNEGQAVHSRPAARHVPHRRLLGRDARAAVRRARAAAALDRDPRQRRRHDRPRVRPLLPAHARSTPSRSTAS